ncbi:MAG: hypothetical protein DMF84_15070 [Acidobacteria bacterium]|nr:MAG: hypothetical protein DMF84_15070 [Acidobacteriota bacterium]
MHITAGSQLGPYRVQELIGKGGMGEVYRAYDSRLDRGVALKVLAPDVPSTQEHLARFAQEARAAATINHPNVVTVYDVGAHDGTPFIISELLEGETLRARLAARALRATAAVAYGRQITEGLIAAHRLGIVHRDLKPENVFITRGERVKILDFGLARCREQAIERLQDPVISTRPGTLLGTVGYMSPEQIRGHALDARSDLFSLGAILYEMVAGAPAFHGDSPIETLSAILRDDPPRLRSAAAAVPEFDRVIRHCLEKDRDARFQSARDLLFNLELVAAARRDRGAQCNVGDDAWTSIKVNGWWHRCFG